MSTDECCAAFLDGLTSDAMNLEACATSYSNYDFSSGTCMADAAPVHPADSAYISAFTTTESRPDEECCEAGCTT